MGLIDMFKPKEDFIESRDPMLFNNDVQIDLASPKKGKAEYFY